VHVGAPAGAIAARGITTRVRRWIAKFAAAAAPTGGGGSCAAARPETPRACRFVRGVQGRECLGYAPVHVGAPAGAIAAIEPRHPPGAAENSLDTPFSWASAARAHDA